MKKIYGEEEGWAYREKSTAPAQKIIERAERTKKVGHIGKNLSPLPKKS